jgi:hypothetical protein
LLFLSYIAAFPLLIISKIFITYFS